jgi:hypothetical protein
MHFITENIWWGVGTKFEVPHSLIFFKLLSTPLFLLKEFRPSYSHFQASFVKITFMLFIFVTELAATSKGSEMLRRKATPGNTYSSIFPFHVRRLFSSDLS